MDKGSLVKSIQGHDKGRLYILTKIEKEFAWCVDGSFRTLEKPKKKRLKHLKDLFSVFDDYLKNDKIYDYQIKTFLNNYDIMHKD